MTHSEPFIASKVVSMATGPDDVPLLTSDTARLQAVERRDQRILADRVVDNGNALAVGDFAYARRDVLARRDDHMSAAIRGGRASAFSSVLTVPIIVTPRARAHWQAIRPTPPAAA